MLCWSFTIPRINIWYSRGIFFPFTLLSQVFPWRLIFLVTAQNPDIEKHGKACLCSKLPISLQYSWLSVEQPIIIDWVLYKHKWEFPIHKKIIPLLTVPIRYRLQYYNHTMTQIRPHLPNMYEYNNNTNDYILLSYF